MKKINGYFKSISLAMALAVLLLFSGCVTTQPNSAGESSFDGNYAKYLENEFGITIPEVVTRSFFIDTVSAITGVDFSKVEGSDTPLTYKEAVSLTVWTAGIKELAYTYPGDKVAETLKDVTDPDLYSLKEGQELAAAIHTGILPTRLYKSYMSGRSVTTEDAAFFLTKALSFHGKYKNYLGEIADEDIYPKICHKWKSSDLIKQVNLLIVMDEGLKRDIITGYNLRDSRNNANFNEELTIRYGHSDITHAIQLTALLKSEGINARVQLEPKTSAFIYLEEWGTPPTSPDIELIQIENGNFIEYTKEYDILFEFPDMEQKMEFQNIILKYAKKNESDQEGLIYGSWWQPLYTSETPIDDYVTITDNVIIDGHYEVHSYSLNEKSDDVISGLQELDPSLDITPWTIWVDIPFYNYLKSLSDGYNQNQTARSLLMPSVIGMAVEVIGQ
jgi:hypothetical protein